MDLISCRNCSTNYHGKFCPNCGQRFFQTPYTVKFITNSALELLDFNRGFFYTLYNATVNPGVLIRNYLSGNTRRYNNPIRFLVTLITLMAILDFVRTFGGDEEIKILYVLPIVLVLAMLTSVFNYVVFRSEFGFAEHIIISIYFSSVVFVTQTFITFLFLIAESLEIMPYSNTWSAVISVLFLLAYLLRFNLQVFSGRPVQLILKSILYLLFLVVVLLLFVLIAKALMHSA